MSRVSDTIRSRCPIVCKGRGHDFRIVATSRESPDVSVEEICCPCGTRLVWRLITHHDACPHCGGEVAYDSSRPMSLAESGAYRKGVCGKWVCKRCGKAGDESFPRDFVEVEEHLVASGSSKRFR